jgi:Zn-finger nucleic acid-binding protein
MICPVCKKDTLIVEYQNIELDYCPSCGGVWFDAGELELLLEAAKLEGYEAYQRDIYGSQEAVSTEKKRKCPICHRKMKKSYIDKSNQILIDFCSQGHGIWFDGGEVQHLVKEIAAGHAGGEAAKGVLAFVGEMLQNQTPGKEETAQ